MDVLEELVEKYKLIQQFIDSLLKPDKQTSIVDILVLEHGLIRNFLDILSIAVEKLEKSEKPPRDFFEKAIEFARYFIDQFHHFKEEHVLFTQLAQKKGGTLDGEIGSLRHQHERGRNHIADIASALDGYAKGNEIHTSTLLENLSAYISLLRRHIHKEDYTYYQMVKQEFSAKELHGILSLFQKEDQKIDSRTFEAGKKIIQDMASLL